MNELLTLCHAYTCRVWKSWRETNPSVKNNGNEHYWSFKHCILIYIFRHEKKDPDYNAKNKTLENKNKID